MLKRQGIWPKVRKLFNDVHLWLGLTSGIIVVLVCLSGTLYTFNTEITEMGAKELYKLESAGEKALSTAQLMNVVHMLGEGNVNSVQIPDDPKRSYQFTVRKEGDNSRFGTTIFVNQYTGDILGTSKQYNGAKEFMSTMFSLHRWLLIDKIEKPLSEKYTNREIGSMISGWATIIFTLGCITGLIIWIPQRVKSWKQGLKIKFSGNWKRTNHDLHNTLGFYSLILLLLMGLTGPQWSFTWYKTGLQKVLGTYKEQPVAQNNGKGEGKPEGKKEEKKKEATEEMPAAELQLISVEEVAVAANRALPYNGNITVTLPKSSKDPYQVSKTKVGFFAPAAGDKLTIGSKNAEVIKVEKFTDKPVNERIAGSIKAIHVGNVYGTFTKILYFFACLVATSLPITGTMIWLNKMKKKKKPASKKPEPVNTNISLS
jgi:uncharacterized iron-regulated membrane protein